MKLQILCNGVGTHADVSMLKDHEQAVPGAQVLLPGETYRGLDFETWSRQCGRTVDLLQLQARLWTRPKNIEPPPSPQAPVIIKKRALSVVVAVSSVTLVLLVVVGRSVMVDLQLITAAGLLGIGLALATWRLSPNWRVGVLSVGSGMFMDNIARYFYPEVFASATVFAAPETRVFLLTIASCILGSTGTYFLLHRRDQQNSRPLQVQS